MKRPDQNHDINKLSFAGLLVTLGIVFGDIGTSPLYTVKAIVAGGGENFNDLLVYGSLSCVFWTLSLQTTIKYILITLRADNKGEGGIFALFALIRKKSTWAAILTMIGGGALLADGVITPAITVTSSIEGFKFKYGGWFTLLLASTYFLIMFGWYFGRKIKNRRITFTDIGDYIELFKDLRKDESVPKIATNLVYIIKANRQDRVESKVIFSIFNKEPKRADTYWFLHVDRVDEPDRFDYRVNNIIPGVLIRVDFHLGFKMDPRINLYFREVLEDLARSGEINLESSFDSIKKHGFSADFKFILIERIMLHDFKLSNTENFILTLRNLINYISISDERALQLDSSNTVVEKVPIIISQPVKKRISRIK